jgi:DNA-binding transcriptional MocR family regulator
MAVLLTDVTPPIKEVATLGQAAVAVYSLLFQSAHQDRRYSVEGNERRDCGGTTHWSHKAIADTLSMSKNTVRAATDKLMDNGFIGVIGYEESSKGSQHRVYRVFHPKEVEAQRHVISLFNDPPSVRYSQRRSTERQEVMVSWDDETDYTDTKEANNLRSKLPPVRAGEREATMVG